MPENKQSKFELRREATRQSLLALGFERFPLKGYSGTSIEDILRDSGHGRGGFYFHFADKADFFIAVLDYRREVRGAWWEIARDPQLRTLREVADAVVDMLPRLMPSPNPWGLLVAEFWRAVNGQGRYDDAIRAYYQELHGEITRYCEELRARDFLRTDLAPDEVATLVYAAFEGLTAHAQVYATRVEGTADVMVRLMQP